MRPTIVILAFAVAFLPGSVRAERDFDVFASTRECSIRKRDPRWKALLSSTDWLKLRVGSESRDSERRKVSLKHGRGDVLALGSNVYLAGCASDRPAALARAAEAGFSKGLSCLAGLGGHWKKVAARLVRLFDARVSEPFVIRCQLDEENFGYGSLVGGRERVDPRTFALAFTCGNELYPGLVVARKQLDLTPEVTDRSLEALFFHEFVHLAGILHGDWKLDEKFGGEDVVFSLQACCFPGSTDHFHDPDLRDSAKACARLKR